MIEIEARFRCEKCAATTKGLVMVEGWEHVFYEMPEGWTQENRERRKGNLITEVKLHFCPPCSKEIEEEDLMVEH